MGMTNAEKQRRFRERRKEKGVRPEWMQDGESKIWRLRVGNFALTLTRIPATAVGFGEAAKASPPDRGSKGV
jgi:hypothetical protein